MIGDAAALEPAQIARQRRRAMRRAVIGVALLAMLLLLLLFIDDDGAEPDSAPSGAARPPALAQPDPSAIAEAAGPIAGGASAPLLPAVTPAPPAEAPPTSLAPAMPVADSAPNDAPSPPPPVAAPADATVATPAATEVATPAADEAAPAARRFPPPPPGNGYMVQLGVFTDTENAAKLLLELAAAGHPVYLQSRVVLGPYPDKAAAQRAQEKIRRERKLDGMIVPPRKP